METRQTNLRRVRLTAWLMVALATLVVIGNWYLRSRSRDVGTVVQTPKLLDDFTFVGDENQPWRLDSTLGRWTLIFFGFTSCPDVCPTSMQYLRDELKLLSEAERQRLQVVLVSVDPERDRDRVGAYARNFSPDFLGVTGSAAQLDAISKFFGVYYTKHAANASKFGYTIVHSGDFFLVDPFGRWVKLYRPPLRKNLVGDDLRQLLRQRSPIDVRDAWVRQPAEGSRVAAAYMSIQIAARPEIKLVGADSPLAGTCELHETAVTDGGMMQMRQVQELPLAADGRLELKPGGAHLMLLDLALEAWSAAQIPITLEFSDGTSIKVAAAVRGS